MCSKPVPGRKRDIETEFWKMREQRKKKKNKKERILDAMQSPVSRVLKCITTSLGNSDTGIYSMQDRLANHYGSHTKCIGPL